jgi:peptidoglycan hydrolase-like protein with peptidoglycan-binding domain
MASLPLEPGDTGELVTAMQNAIVAKGYFIGAAGADGTFNDDTLGALEAFQDNEALPVQPLCDETCWNALGLPWPYEPGKGSEKA